jgi:putative ABC transport system permease protein
VSPGEFVRQALESLLDRPGRAASAALGVVSGAAALVILLAWGSGFTRYMKVEFGRYGQPSAMMIPGVTSSGFPGFREGMRVRVSRGEAARAERENRDRVEAILAEHWAEGRRLVEARGRVRRLDLTATDERFAHVRRFGLHAGRFLTRADVERHRAVAVIGYEAAAELFGDPAQAVGARLLVDGQPFELIGVFADKAGRQYMNTNRPDDRLVVIPNSTAESRLGFDRRAVRVLAVYPRPGVSGEEAIRGVLASFSARLRVHPEDRNAIRWFDTGQTMRIMDLLERAFALFLGLAGTVTLMVGGIGVANDQLARLEERTAEIALAKALGARERTLAALVAFEAGSLAAVAAALGLALGACVCTGIGRVAPPDVFPVPVITPIAMGVSAISLIAVTCVTAVIPARRVRRIELSRALREAG